MSEHSLYGKRKICYTEVTDFTDFQGIGRDPMYKRFDSVYSVVNKNIPEEFKNFLAHPLYSAEDDQIQWYVKDWKETPVRFKELDRETFAKYEAIKDRTIKAYTDVAVTLKGEDRQILIGAMKYIDDDFIFCYDNKVVVVAWGMAPDSNQHIVKGTVIHDIKFQNKRKVYFDAGKHGAFKTKLDGVLSRENGSVLARIDIPTVTPDPGFEFKCWDPNPVGVKITKDVIFYAVYNELPPEELVAPIAEMIKVEFVSDDRGSLIGETVLHVEKGTTLSSSQIPSVQAMEGYLFEGWDKPTNKPIDNDLIISAVFSEKSVHCRFDAGSFGSLSGPSSFTLPFGASFQKQNIPEISSSKGYKFIGWDVSPEDCILKEDTVFTAQYEKDVAIPWYERFCAWFTGKGCLKLVLWLLLAMLLIFLLSQLLRGCEDGIIGGSRDEVMPAEKIETHDGRMIDNNGPIKGIIGDDGKLPDDNIVAPIVGEDGRTPPIVENPGVPDIVGDRLNIYFEEESVDLNQFAADLDAAFPSGECDIVGIDHCVPMLQIKVPSDFRDKIRELLPSKLSNYKFFVVDESIFTIVGHISENNQEDIGWHLRAINLKKGWKYTKGRENVVVAVVDDGIDATHEILKGRFYKPYNVFTQNNHLAIGEGHGTHVAGLAVGSDKYFDKGVSGVAPRCLLMPVQVFDNGVCTFSSVTSGIMYAIHNGANVVNVSIGPNFRGLDILPVADQDIIARTQFKNEERVWRRIIKVANEKNVIIVFAAGNDNIIASIPPENRTNLTVNVAAVARNFKETDFTNYGKGSNVSAPGKEILSSVPTNQYAVFDGTSMAAPIVSGTVALMKSMKSDVAISEVLTILQQTGRSVSNYVPPMVQVDRALEMLKTGVPPADATTDSVRGGVDAPCDTDGLTPPVQGTPGLESPIANDGGGVNTDDSIDRASRPGENEGADYEAIRRMIEFYKQKILELEKLLPENNK